MYGYSYGADGLQEPYNPGLSFQAPQLTDPTTGPHGNYNQSPAYNSQSLLRTSANVTPTKGSMYNMNRMPPQQHMYSYQQPNHTPPMQPPPPCVYPPQEQVFGATNLLSPYSEEHYSRGVTQPLTNLPLPEPGYFTKPSPVTVQPKSIEGKAMDFGKITFGQIALTDIQKVLSLVAGPTSQTAQSSDFKFNSNNFKSNDGDFTFSASPAKHNESLLGLLTSDISTKTDFEQKPGTQDQSTSQGSIFTFGTKNLSGFSFASATTNTGISGAFEKVEKPFSFGDVNKPIDEVEKQPQVEQNQPLESDNDSSQLEDDDDGPHFEPIVPLPDKIDVKTGEEEEQELFCNRAKLYRFEMETKEWKERGIGNIKILKHNISGKVRILMRREQVLKICANHYINADTLLKPNAGSDKSWVWNAIDYADEQPKPEQLAIRFKTAEEAMLFKTKFDEAQQNVPKSPTKHCLQEKRDVGYKLNETKSSFGGQFALKDGEWDCNVCYVRNKPKDIQCVACQTKNPQTVSKPEGMTVTDSKPPPPLGGPTAASSFTFKFGTESSKNSSSTPFSGFGAFGSSNPPFSFVTSGQTLADTGTSAFGAQFNKKQGQWDCDACYVRNESASNSCVACQAPHSSTASGVTKPSETAGPPAETAAAPTTESQSSAFGSSFGSQFGMKAGQWDCDACYVRNESSSTSCVACQTPQDSAASVVSGTFGPPAQMAPAPTSKPQSSAFGSSFGSQFGMKQGQWDCDACYVRNESSSKSCVACQTPQASAASVITEKAGPPTQMKAAPTTKPLSSELGSNFGGQFGMKPGQWDCDACYVRNESSSKSCVACQTLNPLSKTTSPTAKAPCPTSSLGAMFAKKVGEWDCDTCLVRNNAEDMYKTEENDDIQFEPVVQLPEKVDLVTGEEEEQVLYSQRVKLFRFDTGLSQWKERGLGVLKFLKNAANGRLRVLMRREQVLKVCANHWITTTMNLKPLAGSDKAWMWLANDFSDGDARLEQLAAKFKTPELASEFKQKFEECQRLLLDIPLQTPHKLVDTGRTAHLIQKAEEMKTGLKDLKCFLTDGKTKLCDESAANLTPSSNVMGLTVKPNTEGTGPTLEWDNYDLRGEPLDDSADTSVYASPLASSPVRKNLFRFGESTSGFSFSFQPGISPSKSPAKLNQSGVSVGTDDEQDSTQDEDKDGQYFEPIVPLPDLVEISTGEENEQVVFNHRAKLYRYDKDLNQWKERGIGEIRILQNYDTRRVRLIMRRDQVLKICCNHWITTAMKLEMMKGSEKAWVWSALDFTDAKDGRVEQLAVRFKLQDVANAFKEVFEKAKNAQDSETPMTPVTSRVATPQETMPAMTTPTQVCGKEAIAILEDDNNDSSQLEDDDDGPHFEPIVPLPDKIDVKTGEEEEQELFCNRAKLYRFEMETKEWKERGIGNIKILKHNISGKVRILMRREQVLKICANHYINADTLLKPNAGSDKSWVWNAIDYADEQPKPEQLAIRFKTAEEAMLFKTKFDEAQQNVPKSPTKHCLQEKRDVGYKLNETKSSFGGQFALKDGEWDCNVCYVRNKPKDIQCVACQTKNPQTVSKPEGMTVTDSKPPPPLGGPTAASSFTFKFGTESSKNSSSTPFSGFGAFGSSNPPFSFVTSGQTLADTGTSAFGAQFNKKQGQWDCDACYVRNESASNSCVACQAPHSSTASGVTKPSETAGPPAETAAAPTTESQSSAFGSSFGSQFGMKAGQWDCDACYVRNESSSTSCVACQTPQDSAASVVSGTFGPPAQMAPAPTSKPQSSAFGSSFGSQFGMKQGQWDCDACYVRNESSSKSCVACQTPQASAASVITEKAGPPTQMKAAPTTKPLSSELGSNFGGQFGMKPGQWDCDACYVRNESSSKSCVACQTLNPLSKTTSPTAKAPCPTSSLGAMFAKKVGEWDCDTCLVRNNAEDMYKTEENDDIQFEPVVQLPEKVDLVTGEEEEQVLYSQRVKLFRFDTGLSQWKERGLGVLKFLKNAANGRLRVLMRREQVLKVCANHWITTTMNLKPLAGSDKAWMWLANDFSDGDARLEQLAAKFKTPELASEFKQKFEECQRLLLDIPLQTPHKLVDTGRTAHLIQKAEEMKTGLKDLKCFLTDGKTKLCDESAANLTPSSNVMGLTVKPNTEGTGPTLEWDNYDLRGEPLDDSADTSVYASPLASSPVRKNLFRFGESTSGFSFSFQPGISPSKSPAKLNQSGVSVGTDDEQDSTQDEDKDGQYFEPIVPLPDLVEISTGEENEQVVFNHRAKLYRYDKDLNQWKERGIGEIRILQNYDTRRVRLIMRRDQVLKICCNHWITTAMKLEMMKGSEKAWVWSALDFTDAKDGRVEQLAVRFKLQDVANAFKEVFEKAKNAQDSETPMTPVTSRVATPQETMPAMTTPTQVCGKEAIAILEEAIKERTDLISDSQPLTAITSSPSNPMKMVVSPPKFVFDTDALQKIFGPTKSSPEPENYSSNSRTEDNPNVSQSPASPAFKIPEKGMSSKAVLNILFQSIKFIFVLKCIPIRTVQPYSLLNAERNSPTGVSKHFTFEHKCGRHFVNDHSQFKCSP
ncbi:unnamed protein product [Arctogadus glacialis]